MPNKVPLPGRPVRGSKSGKPIMALFDLLGRTWALGIVWQLSESPLTFRQLQERCETVSPTVLNKRLNELKASGFVERCNAGYQLTRLGQELFGYLKPLGAFSQHWGTMLLHESNQQKD